MKTLAILLLTLVGTLTVSGPIQSFADPQLDTLVNIATQARNNLNVDISQINNAPDEITNLYHQGSNETDALTNASHEQNITSARQHFLSAMKFFKATNDKINSLNTSQINDQSRTLVIELQSEITRMEKIEERLRTVALTNNANFDFSQFDQLIQKAKQDLDNGKLNDTSKSIEILNQIMDEAHQSLADIADQKTTDRARDFVEKQIETLNETGDLDLSQNNVSVTPNIANASTLNDNMTFEKNPTGMIVKMKKLISEGNVDEGLKLMKSLKVYEDNKLTKINSEQSLGNGKINTVTNSSNYNFDQKDENKKIDGNIVKDIINSTTANSSSVLNTMPNSFDSSNSDQKDERKKLDNENSQIKSENLDSGQKDLSKNKSMNQHLEKKNELRKLK